MLLAGLGWALTLDEAVARAAEVDPAALVADLVATRTRAEAAEAWAATALTPELSAARSWQAGAVVDSGGFSVSTDLLSPPSWFDAGEQSAQARAETHLAHATRLDAQYAAAALVYEVNAADAAHAARVEGERAAAATLTIVEARVQAGLDSELAARSARVGLLEARAAVAEADAARTIAYARLARALETAVDRVEPAAAPELPAAAGTSPWVLAQAARWSAARWEQGQRLAELFPTAGLSVGTDVIGASPSWRVSLTGTWRFDGVVGPALRLHQAGLDARIAHIEYDALRRDLALGLDVARAQATAADRTAEVAAEREALAAESLAVGQTRLASGLAAATEVLRLQDDLARARVDRVEAERARALARLEARRVAGLPW